MEHINRETTERQRAERELRLATERRNGALLKQVYRACQATQAQLWKRIGPRYPNHAKEGRKLIAAALRAPGSMRLQPGQIWVELAPQPPPTALEWSPNFVKVST